MRISLSGRASFHSGAQLVIILVKFLSRKIVASSVIEDRISVPTMTRVQRQRHVDSEEFPRGLQRFLVAASASAFPHSLSLSILYSASSRAFARLSLRM